MRIICKALALASVSLAGVALTAAPASAQVAGVATANSTLAIAKTKALVPAFQQIDTQYASYVQQIQAKQKEMQALLAKLDTNGDKKVDDAEMDTAEKTKNPILAQLGQKEKEIADLQMPMVKARIYVVEQVARQFAAAQQAVVTARKINYIVVPDALLWAPQGIDVTDAIAAELDKLIPTASTTPPAGWNPSEQMAGLYQQLQQIFAAAANASANRPQAAGAQAPASR